MIQCRFLYQPNLQWVPHFWPFLPEVGNSLVLLS